MDFALNQKQILITGASSGIGRAVAIGADKSNASCILHGRDIDRLRQTAAMLENKSTMLQYNLDVMSEIESMLEELPVLSGAVMNAGIIDYMPVKNLSYERLLKVFNTNVFSSILLIKGLLKKKKLAPGASIVFISSISAKLGTPATAAYAASKGAVNSFAKVLANEVAAQKIRVNTICPGLIKTEGLNQNASLSAEMLEQLEKQYPLGLGAPEDVAALTIFLLSDHARWITGTTVDIDGGFTLN